MPISIHLRVHSRNPPACFSSLFFVDPVHGDRVALLRRSLYWEMEMTRYDSIGGTGALCMTYGHGSPPLHSHYRQNCLPDHQMNSVFIFLLTFLLVFAICSTDLWLWNLDNSYTSFHHPPPVFMLQSN